MLARLDTVEVQGSDAWDGIAELTASIKELRTELRGVKSQVDEFPDNHPTFKWVEEFVTSKGECHGAGPCAVHSLRLALRRPTLPHPSRRSLYTVSNLVQDQQNTNEALRVGDKEALSANLLDIAQNGSSLPVCVLPVCRLFCWVGLDV